MYTYFKTWFLVMLLLTTGLQERDLALQPMFDKNVFAPGKVYSQEYFISTNGTSFMDRAIQIEHLSKTYELKWGMKFAFGD